MSWVDWILSLGLGIVLGVALWRCSWRIGSHRAAQYLQPYHAPANLQATTTPPPYPPQEH